MRLILNVRCWRETYMYFVSVKCYFFVYLWTDNYYMTPALIGKVVISSQVFSQSFIFVAGFTLQFIVYGVER